MMTALLLGANTSGSCLSSLQIECNFFFLTENCHTSPPPPRFFVFFFIPRINVCLPDICARREVFSILFIALSLIPWFSALLLIYALVCVPSESRGSVVLLLLDSCSFLKVTVSRLCFQTNDASTFTFCHLEICYNLLSVDVYPSIDLLLQVYTILLLYHHFSEDQVMECLSWGFSLSS